MRTEMETDRRSKLVVGAAVTGVVIAVALAIMLVLPRPEPSGILIPSGSYALSDGSRVGPGPTYSRQLTHEGRATAAYRLTGSWVASAPTQVIVAEMLGLNFGGCGFLPLNLPPGAPAFGCWPAFGGSTGGSMDGTFHICVEPRALPTGSFVVIFRSQSPAVVTVTDPFIVQETTFPQADCPQSP